MQSINNIILFVTLTVSCHVKQLLALHLFGFGQMESNELQRLQLKTCKSIELKLIAIKFAASVDELTFCVACTGQHPIERTAHTRPSCEWTVFCVQFINVDGVG